MTPPIAVPASEFRQNFAKYAALVENQDFIVTRNGKPVGLWTNPAKDKLAVARELAGSIHAEVDLAADRAERRAAL